MDSGLCSKCQKFFGSQEGMCSKCYKDSKNSINPLPPLSSLLQVPVPEESKASTEIQSDRCEFCKKLLPPINFKCKCSYFYCSKHRLPEEHNCTYDHKSIGIRKLSEENPLVQAEKFNKL